LHLHYCCGHLSDIHLFGQVNCNHDHDDSDHCCKKNDCCSFVHVDLKIDDSHQPTESSAFHLVEFPVKKEIAFNVVSFNSLGSSFQTIEDSSPPIERRFVLFHSLMLYA
jgi:hypothetical protein